MTIAIYTLSLHDALPIFGILNNWRHGVYLFLAWLLFEDFARKFLGNNMAIYFAKDFLAKSLQTAARPGKGDRKSTRLNSSHLGISYAVFCLKKKKNK